MAAAETKCSVGRVRQEDCSQPSFLLSRTNLSEKEVKLIELRSGVAFTSLCQSHFDALWKFFSSLELVCCAPLDSHTKEVRKGLWVISQAFHVRCQTNGIFKAIEGKKVCINCKKNVLAVLKDREAAVASGAGQVYQPPCLINPQEEGTSGLRKTTTSLHSSSPMRNVLGTSSPSSAASSNGKGESSSSANSPKKASALEKLNLGMEALGISPIKPKELRRSKRYAQRKSDEAKSTIQESFSDAAGKKRKAAVMDHGIDYERTGQEIIESLKRKFSAANSSEKMQVLSLIPKFWSYQTIIDVFGATRHMVEKTRQRVEEDGILCIPAKKPGRPMPESEQEIVTKFYREADISRELPGKKQFKSVVENGKRVHKQKRLVLGNLKEIFAEFKKRNPEVKIGFSKFADLRPPECVLAGSSGTHTVCVCTIHQNVKLMFEGGKIIGIRDASGESLYTDYVSCITGTLCDTRTEKCYFGECNNCPGTLQLKAELTSYYDDNFIVEITYMKWTQTDRCNYLTVTQPSTDFIDSIVETIPKLARHHYIAKKQGGYFRKTRENLRDGEVLVVADFSENYSCVLQDSAQGVHWNNQQATVHPFACYYRDPETTQIKPLNYVVISDCKDHVSTTVYAFQIPLIEFLRTKIPNLNKVVYFSDGSPTQYKNKYNMLNLMYHKEDFGVDVEWHFFATSHGKGPSDGLGGTVKREASRASLLLPPEKQIQTAIQLFQWCEKAIKNIDFVFVSQDEVSKSAKKLKRRFRDIRKVDGIRSFHGAVPLSTTTLQMSTTSESEEGTLFQLRDPDTSSAHDPDDPEVPERPQTRSQARRVSETPPSVANVSRRKRRRT